jgi:cobalt/nickel transport system ATP-binding protein
VIVVDEPMAYLDPAGQRDVIAVLNHLNQQGTTIVIATHDVDLAAAWAEQVIILKEGTVWAAGGPNLLADSELMRQADLRVPLVSQIFQGVPQLSLLPKTPLSVEEGIMGLQKLLESV